MTRWWWIRHAPVPDPEGRILGRLDTPCDTSDAPALEALAARLPQGASLIVSPLLRAQQTAHALEAAGARLAVADEEPAFTEQSFGDWQGRTWSALSSRVPPDLELEAFWRSPGFHAPPGGESFANVVGRVAAAVDFWSAKLGDRDVVVVAHAGSIRAALAQALDMTPDSALRIAIDPQSLTRIDRIPGPPVGWRVGAVNTVLP